jgi:hypothetical protein
MTRTRALLVLVWLVWLAAALGAMACAGEVDETTRDVPPPGATTGREGTTFDHDNNGLSMWDMIDRLAKQGPPSLRSRVHSCRKLRYATLGRVLASVGVDLTSAADPSAGKLYRDSAATLGAPDYTTRSRETAVLQTSAAARQFDIFATGADEILAALPTLARCKIGANGVQLFDGADGCLADGISCLIGWPAQTAHVEVCNQTVQRASDHAVGRRLAVAVLLSAAYTCE